MQLLAVLGLGFSGFAIGGWGGGTPASNPFDAPLVRSPLVEPQAPAGAGIFVPIHKPTHFKFVTIVKDDGKGPAGGWQAAKANLPFQKVILPVTLITWYCPLTIGVPIRHSVRGYISPAAAAAMSAAVTNSVASRMNFDLPQGVFCHTFRKGVEAAFPAMYPVGATVGR
ncbi:MAG: hypothetical protein IPM54_12750 [Polyangiaceae bacterium]|nr:hypothetical protein [Polyangiaceae bacterium]